MFVVTELILVTNMTYAVGSKTFLEAGFTSIQGTQCYLLASRKASRKVKCVRGDEFCEDHFRCFTPF